MSDQQNYEDAVLKVITRIYASRNIPEEHKQAYVDNIKANGFTDKMLDELEKFFVQDAATLDELQRSHEQLSQELGAQVKEEQEKNDDVQAGILFAVHQANQNAVQELDQKIVQTEKDIETAFENVGKKTETSEIEKIRATLKKK